MSTPGSCLGCGFAFGDRTLTDAVVDLPEVANAWAALLRAGGPLEVRPAPDRWSPLEYGGHVRDVLLTLRDRVLHATVADGGVGTPIFRDERMDRGVGVCGTAVEVADDLVTAASLLARTLQAVGEERAARTIQYSPQTAFEASITWMANQAVHEATHHLADAQGDAIA